MRLVEATGKRILASAADTRDHHALRVIVDKGVAEFGRLDVIVANAGITVPEPWNETTPQSFKDVMDINVTGTWNTVMAGAQHIIDGGRGGSIILISSAAGIKMQPFMVHYTASKHAVAGMARAFAAELGKHKIRVNSLHPGAVNTPMGTGDMLAALNRANETNPGLMQMVTPFLPDYVARRRHRRRGDLAGQRRVSIRHCQPRRSRPGLHPVLIASSSPRRRPRAGGLSR